MQKFYELVLLIHPQTSKEEMDAINSKIDKLLGDGKKQTDDMGLMQLKHPIGKAKLTQANMISFYCQIDGAKIPSIKRELSITKGVIRFAFFAMNAKDQYFTYAEVNKKFEQLIKDAEEAEEKEKKVEENTEDKIVIEGEDGETTVAEKEVVKPKVSSKKRKEMPVRK